MTNLISRLLARIDRLSESTARIVVSFLIAVASAIIALACILLCWIALKQIQSSTLPDLKAHTSLVGFLRLYFALILALHVSYVAWIFAVSRPKLRSANSISIGWSSNRLSLVGILPFLAALTDFSLFRILWSKYELPQPIGGAFSLNPSIMLQDLGVVVLVVTMITGVNRWFARVSARQFNLPTSPVVGVTPNGKLLRADGHQEPMPLPMPWPTRGLRRRSAVAVVSVSSNGGAVREAVVTDSGDLFLV